jgi:hypothetical protein
MQLPHPPPGDVASVRLSAFVLLLRQFLHLLRSILHQGSPLEKNYTPGSSIFLALGLGVVMTLVINRGVLFQRNLPLKIEMTKSDRTPAGDLNLKFLIWTTGSEPALDISATTSCGCSVAAVPSQLLPGEVKEFRVTIKGYLNVPRTLIVTMFSGKRKALQFKIQDGKKMRFLDSSLNSAEECRRIE